MAPEPGSVFGNLLRGCISDRYLPKDRGMALESALMLFLGISSSLATTYFLFAARILL